MGLNAPVPTQVDGQVVVSHSFVVATQGNGGASALQGQGVAGFVVGGWLNGNISGAGATILARWLVPAPFW
jgi:hypothetical protein